MVKPDRLGRGRACQLRRSDSVLPRKIWIVIDESVQPGPSDQPRADGPVSTTYVRRRRAGPFAVVSVILRLSPDMWYGPGMGDPEPLPRRPRSRRLPPDRAAARGRRAHRRPGRPLHGGRSRRARPAPAASGSAGRRSSGRSRSCPSSASSSGSTCRVASTPTSACAPTHHHHVVCSHLRPDRRDPRRRAADRRPRGRAADRVPRRRTPPRAVRAVPGLPGRGADADPANRLIRVTHG